MDDWSKGENLPDGYVPQTIFWYMKGDLPVGLGKIRHRATQNTKREGHARICDRFRLSRYGIRDFLFGTVDRSGKEDL